MATHTESCPKLSKGLGNSQSQEVKRSRFGWRCEGSHSSSLATFKFLFKDRQFCSVVTVQEPMRGGKYKLPIAHPTFVLEARGRVDDKRTKGSGQAASGPSHGLHQEPNILLGGTTTLVFRFLQYLR